MIAHQESDVNLQLAIRAHEGTSFSPERRGKSYVDSYMAHMAAVTAEFEQWRTDENAEEMAADLERYRAKYLELMNNYLHSKTHCISSFITGPSNFPVRKARKASDRADKHMFKWLDYQDFKLKKLRRKYNPRQIAQRPIRLDDGDAVERLERKIARLERNQEAMKAANKVVRNKKLTDDEKIDEIVNGVGFSEETARELLRPNYMGKVAGFEGWALSNNNANIRRCKDRLVEIERELNREASEYETPAGLEVVENAAETRIQLIFDDKPPAEVRAILKRHGFRWAPSKEAWQRLLNANGREAARRVISLIREEL